LPGDGSKVGKRRDVPGLRKVGSVVAEPINHRKVGRGSVREHRSRCDLLVTHGGIVLQGA